jgi:hypothetical protein
MQPLDANIKVRLDAKSLFLCQQAADKAGLRLGTWLRNVAKHAAEAQLGKVATRKLITQRLADTARHEYLLQKSKGRAAEAPDSAPATGLEWDWTPATSPPTPQTPVLEGGQT